MDNCPAESAVAVVIPIYNRASVVLGTLDSVARQTHPPAVLIVVDDGSTDGSSDAVRSWADRARPRFEVRVMRTAHGTAAGARNVGWRELESRNLPFLAFLDSDDLWPPDFLARTTRQLAENPDAVAVTCDRRFFDHRRSAARRVIRAAGQQAVPMASHSTKPVRPDRYDNCELLARDPILWIFRHGAGIASATLLRSWAVAKVGGWNTSYQSAEDSVLFTSIALLGKWLHAPGLPVDFHHGNAAGRREETNLSRRHEDAYRKWAFSYERIYEYLSDELPSESLARLHRPLAVYWYRAGKQLERLRRHAEADFCYQRALGWQRLFVRAWYRHFVSTTRRIAAEQRAA
jgi:glycosyltransferase involved in cell wall biosynthesis